MSYILDALRKSDQLRQRGAAPTLLLGQATVTAPRKTPLVFYGLLALVLLAAGIAIGWLRPWQQEAAPAVVVAKSAEPRQSQTPVASPEIVSPTQPQPLAQLPVPAAPVAGAIVPATEQAPAPAPAPAIVDAGVKHEPQNAQPKVVAEAPTIVPTRKPAPRAGEIQTTATAPATLVIALTELPLAIQQELPPLSISVHAYSAKESDRLVGVNGRLLHQGDEAAPGLMLEEITSSGMIFSYKGYRFRRGVK